MKAFKAILLYSVVATALAGCASDSKKVSGDQPGTPAIPKPITGDFNGDGKTDTLKMIKPKLAKDGMSCIDSTCITYIKFSDTTIKAIAVKNAIGGSLENLGDLNGDGKDEIGLLPDWFTSCWREYHVYTLKNNEWIAAVPGIPTHCNQWEANIKPIEKDSLNKGYVIIHYSEMVGDSIKTKSKIVAIKK